MTRCAKYPSGHGPKTLTASAQKSRLMRALGPGLITGASDDDPSGIATYSQAGAQFSYATAWTLLLTYPLMCAIQEISARIGRRHRSPALFGKHHQPWADLGAMGNALTLLLGGPQLVNVVIFGMANLRSKAPSIHVSQISFPTATAFSQ